MEVALLTQILRVFLHCIIENDIMKEHGQQIIALILGALLQLEDLKLVNRNIFIFTTYLS